MDLTGLVTPRLMADEVTVERSLTLRDAVLGGGPFAGFTGLMRKSS